MNLLITTGNLTRDCERKTTPSGKYVCAFTVACNVGYNENKRVEYYECELWGKRAEGKLPEYLLKGTKVLVHGDPKHYKNEHNGKTYAGVKVFVHDVELLGGKKEEPAQETRQAIDNDFDNDKELPF